jgi:hypothetical protein
MQIDYFKREQEKGIYNYVRVVGGPGKTPMGYQETICFLNEEPLIIYEANDLTKLVGTWCNFEVAEPIEESEYKAAFMRATENEFAVV